MTEGSIGRPSRVIRWAWRKRLELWLLGGVFLAGLLFLVFGEIAEGVVDGDPNWFDAQVLLAFRDAAEPATPIGPSWLEEAARDITALGSAAVLGVVTLAAIAYLLLIRRVAAALLVFVAVAGGQMLSTLLKEAIARPRPDLVAHAAETMTPSFPSGHAMLSAVTYLTIGALLASTHDSRRLKAFFVGLAIVITFAVGLTRVYLGVHYPTDVLAGWCLGAAWAAMCWTVFHALQIRGFVKPATHDMINEGDETNGR